MAVLPIWWLSLRPVTLSTITAVTKSKTLGRKMFFRKRFLDSKYVVQTLFDAEIMITNYQCNQCKSSQSTSSSFKLTPGKNQLIPLAPIRKRGELVIMAEEESVAMLGAPLIGLTRLQCHQHSAASTPQHPTLGFGLFSQPGKCKKVAHWAFQLFTLLSCVTGGDRGVTASQRLEPVWSISAYSGRRVSRVYNQSRQLKC